MPLTEKEKSIYNSFLATSRKVKNLPFKLRQDFSNIDDKTYVALKKLGAFFKLHNLNYTDFFTAPYDFYDTTNYFDLSFFTSLKAIKCYTLYARKKETQSPDSKETIDACKRCCSFIYKFCKENNLSLQDYKTKINGTTPLTLQHLREHKINFYTLHGLDCEKNICQIEPELLDFFIKGFYNMLNETRILFQSSDRLKKVVREALSIVDIQLKKQKK